MTKVFGDKGYGFLKAVGVPGDVFFHTRDLAQDDGDINQGDQLAFVLVKGKKKGRLRAVQCVKLSSQTGARAGLEPLCKQIVDGFICKSDGSMKELALKCVDILEWLTTDDPSDDLAEQQLRCLMDEVQGVRTSAKCSVSGSDMVS